MATNQIDVRSGPAAVFDVLLDPRNCAYWVVGTRSVGAVDDAWPTPGSRFEHSVGLRWLNIQDHTVLVSLDTPRRMEMEARARPLGRLRIVLEATPIERGTRLTMVEEPVSGPVRWLPQRVFDLLVGVRNRTTLRRLRELAEKASPARGTDTGGGSTVPP